MDEDLKFPILKNTPRKPRKLSLDEYHAFVQYNLSLKKDRSKDIEMRAKRMVNVRFRLID